MGFAREDSLARYRKLMQDRPDLFAGDADGIRILTDDLDIRRAQDVVADQRTARGHDVTDLRVGVLAQDPFMTVLRDAVRFPDGSLGLHNRVVEQQCIAVLPLLHRRPVLLRIFRHGLRDWTLEFPRGAIEADETPEEAVHREVGEEIGARVLSLTSLGAHSPGGSSLSIRSALFVATIDGIEAPERGEGIESIHPVDVGELERMIRTGDIIDGFTLSLFARARACGVL